MMKEKLSKIMALKNQKNMIPNLLLNDYSKICEHIHLKKFINA